MKACTVCSRVLPNSSFPAHSRTRSLLSSWCIDCYREKRRDWHRASPGNRRAWREEQRVNPDPVEWAGAHCRHISTYVTKVIARFESKTGMEAPPQLTAIRQLADQMADELPARERYVPGKVICRNCGREFKPRKEGWAAYCSSYCKGRFRQVKVVMESALVSAGQSADK